MTANRTPQRRRCRDERGSASALMVGVMSVVVALSLAAMVVAGYLVAAHRARGAADLSALSAASAYGQGGDACDEARRVARRNTARVRHCDVVGDRQGYVVTVRVVVRIGAGVPAALRREVVAEAHAGPVG